MPDILVLGATGYTGRFAIKALDAHPQRKHFTFAIGVRSLDRGETLKKQLGLNPAVPLVKVDVLNAEEVDAAVRDAKVVMNLTGPYWLFGLNVQKSCAVHGKRYVDLAGELHSQKKMIEQFDYLATKTGAILIPACGFDSIPSDLLVDMSNRSLKSAHGPNAELGLSQTFFSTGTGVSGGSVASMLASIEHVPAFYMAEVMRDWALSPVRGHPSPSFSLAVPMPFTSPQRYGSLWILGRSNRGCVQRTWGLRELAAAVSTEKDEGATRYGPRFRYSEHFVHGTSKFAAAASSMGLIVLFTLVTYCLPVRWLFKTLMPAPGSGPSEADAKKGKWEITNITECASSPGGYARSTVSGTGDVGYYRSGNMVVESALALLLDEASLPKAARLGGVLTPATALGNVLVSRLTEYAQFRFEGEVIPANPESRKDR